MNNAAARAPAGELRGGLIKIFVFGVLMVVVLGLTGGTWSWWRAWLYAGLTLTGQLAATVWIHRKNPGLLEERSRMREGTKPWDKPLVLLLAVVGPLTMWMVAGINIRTNGAEVLPLGWTGLGFALCAAGYAITLAAMLVNPFFATTVRLQQDRGQRAVDTGPYSVVRHPGYSGVLLFTIGTPLALGAWWAFAPAAFTIAVLVIRTALEDRTLKAELSGYLEYASRVRSRLVPGLW